MAALAVDIHPELHYLLHRRYRRGPIRLDAARRASAKDVVESLGIPHTEVGALQDETRTLGFDDHPRNGQRLSVQPVSAPFDVTRPSRLRPVALSDRRFIVDVNVARLAPLLRLLGFDARLATGLDDRLIARVAERDQRIVLSRDAGLLKRRRIVYARHVRAWQPDSQLVEVVAFFGLGPYSRPFTRCLRCNHRLAPVAKETVRHRLEPKTKRYYTRFYRCPGCNRIFWQGSHHADMRRRLQSLGIECTAAAAADARPSQEEV